LDIDKISVTGVSVLIGLVTAVSTAVTVLFNYVGQKRRDKIAAKKQESESEKIEAETARIIAETKKAAASTDSSLWIRASESIDELRGIVAAEKTQRRALEGMVEQQHDEIADYRTAQARLESASVEQGDRIVVLEDAVILKDAAIARANDRANSEMAQKNELREFIIEQGLRIDALEKNVLAYKEKVEEYEKKVVAYEGRIRLLETENTYLRNENSTIKSKRTNGRRGL